MDYQNEFYQAHKYDLKRQTLENLKNLEDILGIPSVELCLEVYAEILSELKQDEKNNIQKMMKKKGDNNE